MRQTTAEDDTGGRALGCLFSEKGGFIACFVAPLWTLELEEPLMIGLGAGLNKGKFVLIRPTQVELQKECA